MYAEPLDVIYILIDLFVIVLFNYTGDFVVEILPAGFYVFKQACSV